MSDQDKSFLRHKLEYSHKMQNNALQEQAECTKELHNLSSSNDPNIFKSYFSDLFNDIIGPIRESISQLNSEQLVIVFNLCGYTILTMIMTSIIILLIGDHLINKFELESKYPKMAKYIKFQLTLRKYYMRFYIIYFYITILILIFVNIFMLSFDYIYLYLYF